MSHTFRRPRAAVCGFLTALGLAAAAAATAPASASGPILAPHRAVYDMALATAGAGAGISALSGRMVFELKGNACDGYEQHMRFVTQTVDRRGQPTISDQRSIFREDAGANKFQFESSQYRDDRLTETVEGAATRTKDGDKLQVRITRPAAKRIDFARPVVFPVEHSIRLLEAAQTGQRLFSADLYDGSEKGAKVFATTAVVGDRRDAGVNGTLEPAEGAKPLDKLAAWPVSLSYFETGESREDAVPAYELSFLFFENGVSRKLLIDYGSFAMTGRLIDLKMYPTKPCSKKP